MATTTIERGGSRLRGADWVALAVAILVCNGAGLLGALTTDPGFYRELERPGWAPPSAVFGPVWTTLYTLMGIAAWTIWRQPRSPQRRGALTLFAVQLVLNALWTPLFFGLQALGVALIEIIVLLATILLTIGAFWKLSRPAALLLVPYALWVGFATVLNYTLWRMNG